MKSPDLFCAFCRSALLVTLIAARIQLIPGTGEHGFIFCPGWSSPRLAQHLCLSRLSPCVLPRALHCLNTEKYTINQHQFHIGPGWFMLLEETSNHHDAKPIQSWIFQQGACHYSCPISEVPITVKSWCPAWIQFLMRDNWEEPSRKLCKNTVRAQNIYANAWNRIRFAASLSYEVLYTLDF